MFELRCTVRNCDLALTREEQGLYCSSGHHFDLAKAGYWNLTQPQDKKSAHPGDSRDAVLARHRWLNRGHASDLIQTMRAWIATPQGSQRIVDLGCGDGTFGPALFGDHAATYCGIDLSKPAIKLAARRWPEATWVLANADRRLPIADASVNLVVSLFGRRPVSEIRRVLESDGCCVVAVPAEDDLIELRERIQKEGKRRSRVGAIIEEMAAGGLQCVEQKRWCTQVRIEPDEVLDALAMTYRAGRKSEQELVPAIPATTVTLSADLLKFRTL